MVGIASVSDGSPGEEGPDSYRLGWNSEFEGIEIEEGVIIRRWERDGCTLWAVKL